MPAGHRIAEVARRSGFTPATLRYYEEIGLLPAPARTPAGYRLYDDRALDRLAFIARAKQLGCTLAEIGDLAIAWDGGRCGPVQDRLRGVVAAKMAGAQAGVVELMTLTAELQRAAAALEQHRPAGRCDDRCGCTASEATVTSIACTLGAESMPGRVEDWNRLLDFVIARSNVADGVRLELSAEAPLEDVVRLATDEQECCRFFSFALTIDARGVGLEVRAPTDALPIVYGLFGAP